MLEQVYNHLWLIFKISAVFLGIMFIWSLTFELFKRDSIIKELEESEVKEDEKKTVGG